MLRKLRGLGIISAKKYTNISILIKANETLRVGVRKPRYPPTEAESVLVKLVLHALCEEEMSMSCAAALLSLTLEEVQAWRFN